jgi:hypothetical protein
MKKFMTLLFFSLFLIINSGMISLEDPPRRQSFEVADVFQPYNPPAWIISPNEEPAGDQDVLYADECDIKGILSCYDENYLRVDIILNNSITFNWKTIYGVVLEYTTTNEWYWFSTENKNFVYAKEEDGELFDIKTLNEVGAADRAGTTNSGEAQDSDIYFIINKNDHIGGVKGENYYLTCTFFSGYLTKENSVHIGDETMSVKLEFKY